MVLLVEKNNFNIIDIICYNEAVDNIFTKGLL
jgi:hypothetical protein